MRQPLVVVGCRSCRERLCFRQFFARDFRFRYRTFLDRPDRLARYPVEGIGERLLCGLNDNGYFLAVDIDIQKDWSSWRVVIPDVVMDHLEMPDPLAGIHIQRDQAGAEQVVTRAETTVEVQCCTVRRDIDNAVFLVGGQWRPGGNVAGPLPCIIFPGLVTVLAGTWQDIELPKELATFGVISKYVAGNVFDTGLVVTLFGGVADYDHAVHNDRW